MPVFCNLVVACRSYIDAMTTFDQDTISTLRDVLREAAEELGATTATQAKMAETLTRRAAESRVSREELKEVALEAGRVPAA